MLIHLAFRATDCTQTLEKQLHGKARTGPIGRWNRLFLVQQETKRGRKENVKWPTQQKASGTLRSSATPGVGKLHWQKACF